MGVAAPPLPAALGGAGPAALLPPAGRRGHRGPLRARRPVDVRAWQPAAISRAIKSLTSSLRAHAWLRVCGWCLPSVLLLRLVHPCQGPGEGRRVVGPRCPALQAEGPHLLLHAAPAILSSRLTSAPACR